MIEFLSLPMTFESKLFVSQSKGDIRQCLLRKRYGSDSCDGTAHIYRDVKELFQGVRRPTCAKEQPISWIHANTTKLEHMECFSAADSLLPSEGWLLVAQTVFKTSVKK